MELSDTCPLSRESRVTSSRTTLSDPGTGTRALLVLLVTREVHGDMIGDSSWLWWWRLTVVDGVEEGEVFASVDVEKDLVS